MKDVEFADGKRDLRVVIDRAIRRQSDAIDRLPAKQRVIDAMPDGPQKLALQRGLYLERRRIRTRQDGIRVALRNW
jgi:hypothetical protein